MIIGSGTFVGVFYAQKLTRRRDILLSFSSLFIKASIRIEYNASDLCEVFSDPAGGCVFRHTAPFPLQWQEYIDSFTGTLKSEDIRLLKDFVNGLGVSDCLSQQKHITLYQHLVDEQIKQAQEDINNKAKLYRVVPFSLSVIIAILVI